ncbi:MAG: hypothetical protein IPQ09_07155 [Myxococcales bacterium]|nr:hypothetical protein [Myxococcales bacterium]
MTRFPWHVAPEELFALRGDGGQRFADFLSAVIRAEGAASGVRSDDIQTNTRVNLPDGGVDAEVRLALGGPLDLRIPTCWQFKATLFSAVNESSLREEANKPESRRLIETGYGYYLCVCDDAPPNKMKQLDESLLRIIREISPDAPAPRVLNVGHLADWASRHPGIVLQFFRQHLGQALNYDAWLRRERADTSDFVELSTRAEAADKLRHHVAAEAPARPLLAISAPSGAGVSRLVAETLAPVAPRVIYVPDSAEALGIVTSLVNQPTATGILVLDRCSTRVRMGVGDLLKAGAGRLRAVALQDATEGASDITIKLNAIDGADVQRVIDANFQTIPWSYRRAFVEFADGSLNIAVRLATSYGTRSPQFLPDAAAWAHDELRRLVRDGRDIDVLRALSLFHRVGFKGEVASQLDAVCDVFALSSRDALQRCRRLSTSPGVVAVGSRYISVRPRLFARPLFETAWEDVIGDEVGAFMDALSAPLEASFLKQAGLHAPRAARDALAEWAAPWVRTLAPTDLGASSVLPRLLLLVEVCPNRLAPIFSDLVERASDDEARAAGERVEHWPARTHVIWACRRLLARRELHGLSERALFRLARVEGDPEGSARNSSDATGTWAASFRIFLSGTEVSFDERLSLLASKVDQYGGDAIPLVVAALDLALDSHASKTEGASIASGEIGPADWRPRTYREIWASLDGAISLLARCMSHDAHRALCLRTLIRHARGLLQSGRLDALRSALETVSLDDRERMLVLRATDYFLGFDGKGGGETTSYPSEYVASIEVWHNSLRRDDLCSRLLEALSSGCRRQVDDGDEWAREIDELGRELSRAAGELVATLPSLVGGEHVGAGLFELGRAVGKEDSGGEHLAMVLGHAAAAKDPLFIRGYIVGLVEDSEAHDSALKSALDRLEEHNPDMAVDLNGMIHRIGSAGSRAIRLVRAGRLPAERLSGVWSLQLDRDLLGEALETVLDAMVDRPEDAAATGLKLLGPIAWDAARGVPKDARTLAVMWRVLETAMGGAGAQALAWGRVLRRLSVVDFARAVRLASLAVVNAEYSVQEAASCELSVHIGTDAAFVLEVLGPMLLDRENPWNLLVGRGGAVLNSFPVELVKKWTLDNGVDAARVVARHMPAPYVDAQGSPVVPPLTAFVLGAFEDDDKVFSSFCTGGHNGRMYCGDIAGAHDKEADVAERFRTHPLRRVREWADLETQWARDNAQRWREHDEEAFDE